MNAVEKKFIDILRAYVHDEKVNVVLDNKTTWGKILEESREHCVDGVVYSTIKWDDNTTFIDKNLKNEWKNSVFFQSIWQISHINKTCDIFKKLNEENIEFIALKGFIIRELYKRPEHRTMGDIDILVHKEDLERISSYLYDLGYKKDGETGHHIGFEKNGYPSIEVHWKLVNKNYFKAEVPLEKEVWKNIKKVNVNGVEVLVMSTEDMLVHLCLHMAVHIAAGGFGVRQLLDIALIVKVKSQDINWKLFKEKNKENNIEKFSYLIFLMCNIIFDIDIPKELKNSFNIRKEEIIIFIEDVLKSGVHGKRDVMASFKADAAFNLDKDSINNSVFKRYFKIILPPSYKMSDKYNYAKKNSMLLPFAWIHRLFNGLFNKEYKLSNKISFFSINVLRAYKRNRLLKWLEL